jgi:hypothetical protein
MLKKTPLLRYMSADMHKDRVALAAAACWRRCSIQGAVMHGQTTVLILKVFLVFLLQGPPLEKSGIAVEAKVSVVCVSSHQISIAMTPD